MTEPTVEDALRAALEFYADPASYEVQHSKDPDVCSSVRCGCWASPITLDEGDKARAVLSELRGRSE